MMTRDPPQSRAQTRLSVFPPQPVWCGLSLKQVKIRATAAANMDFDGDNLITIIDLFLAITLWFASCVSMLMCYCVFDTFDRMRRNRDIELGSVTRVVDAQDVRESNNEDSETDESIVSEEQGVTIDNFHYESAYFTNGDLA